MFTESSSVLGEVNSNKGKGGQCGGQTVATREPPAVSHLVRHQQPHNSGVQLYPTAAWAAGRKLLHQRRPALERPQLLQGGGRYPLEKLGFGLLLPGGALVSALVEVKLQHQLHSGQQQPLSVLMKPQQKFRSFNLFSVILKISMMCIFH